MTKMRSFEEKRRLVLQRIVNKRYDELDDSQKVNLHHILEKYGLGLCDNCGRVKRRYNAYINGWWCMDCQTAERE